MANNPRRNTVQSLERGLGVLEAVSAANGPIGITELSRQLGLAKGSVSRLVTTLVKLNFLVRDPETRKYQLGLKLWELGSKSITRLDIRGVARPVMEELHRVTGETVHLTVLSSEGKMVFLDKLDSTRSIRPNVQLGAHLPVHCVANGKAVLAFLPENQVAAILANRLQRFTDTTITKKGDLMAVVESIRGTGYAVNAGEFREDVSGVAAAICDHTNYAVAALGISLPSSRMTEAEARKLGILVAEKAREISTTLGNQHDEASRGSSPSSRGGA
ncbi:MAG: IclR family transcriptional regulator [Alphaproteobacteria bacterium]